MSQPLPWHRGTGVVITPDMTVQEQLEAAKLDWTIETRPFDYGYCNTQSSAGVYEAAFRSDNEALISVYGKRRRPYQNKQVVESFNNFCDDAELTVDYLGSTNAGKNVYAAAKLPIQVNVKNVGDISEAYIVLNENHCSGTGDKIFVWMNRLVCTNGMRRWVKEGQTILSHSVEFSPSKVQFILQQALKVVHKHEVVMNALADVQLTLAEVQMHLIKAFGNPEKEVYDQPSPVRTALKLYLGEGAGSDMLSSYNTAYGLLNAVTELQNHHSKIGTGEKVFSSLVSGSRASVIDRFEQHLVSVHLH